MSHLIGEAGLTGKLPGKLCIAVHDVGMYVSMYVCICVSMYVCICVSMYVCICVFTICSYNKSKRKIFQTHFKKEMVIFVISRKLVRVNKK